jgi:hypothetical protein
MRWSAMLRTEFPVCRQQTPSTERALEDNLQHGSGIWSFQALVMLSFLDLPSVREDIRKTVSSVSSAQRHGGISRIECAAETRVPRSPLDLVFQISTSPATGIQKQFKPGKREITHVIWVYLMLARSICWWLPSLGYLES